MAAAGEVCVSTPSVGQFACLLGIRFVLSPMFSKEIPCAAWAVKTSPDASQANMGWSAMKVTDVAVAQGPHERQKSTRPAASAQSVSAVSAGAEPAAASAQSASELGKSASEFDLAVPVMINTRALSNEEELVLHRPRMSQGKKTVPVKLAKIMTPKVQQNKKSGPA